MRPSRKHPNQKKPSSKAATCGDFGGRKRSKSKPEEIGIPCSSEAGWGTNHLGSGRCRRHGGNIDPLASAKHGLSSNMAPPRIQEKMERLIMDENLMDLTFENALVRAQLEAKIEDIRDGAVNMEANWQRAKELYEVAMANAADQNGVKALSELGQLLRGQKSTTADWAEANALVELRAKLSIAFGRNLRDQNLMVPVHEVQMFLLRLTSILNDELEGFVDESKLNRIANRIEAFS